MSNPLLRPDDPRFQKRSLTDAAGNNLFADPDGVVPAETADGQPVTGGSNLFAPSTDETPYQPHYVTNQAHRGMTLMTLAILGLLGMFFGFFAFTGLFMAGWMLCVLGLAPATAAWLLGMQDLRSMRLGAMDSAGIVATRLSCYLGLAGLIGCLTCIGLVIYTGLDVLSWLN